MTISFVGFGASDKTPTPPDVQTPVIPSGIAAGDFLILIARTISDVGVAPTFSAPSSVGGVAWTLGGTQSANIGGVVSVDMSFTWWYLRTVGAASGTVSVTVGGGAAFDVLQIAALRGVSPLETLTNFEVDISSVDVADGDPLQPQATQTTADGILVGWFLAEGVPMTIDSAPPGWACSTDLNITAEPYGGWCSGRLTDGPLPVADAPVTFVSNEAVTGFQWITFWVSAPEGATDCLLLPSDAATLDGATTDTARAGFCSDSYVVLAADGDQVTFTVTLTLTEATLLNLGADGAGFYLRGFILTDDDYNQSIVIGLDQLEFEINASGFGSTTFNLPEVSAADSPDPAQWQTVLTAFSGDWVAGANTFTVRLTDASLEYNPGQFSTLSVYLDLALLALCTPVEVDGCPTCADCGGIPSCVTEVTPIRDFPTSATGTISGRPPLLCAEYAVWIADRVTGATVVRLPSTGWTLKFNRRVDRTSNATLVVDYTAEGQAMADCCSRLGRVGEWMHELVVQREGDPQEQWGGPIMGLEDDPKNGTLTISADDRSAWWDERALPYDLNYVGADIHGNSRARDAARVFVELLRAAEQPTSYLGVPNSGGQLLPYDPVGLEAHAYPTGVMIDKKVLLKADDVVIGEELRTLGGSVLDWTVIGRRVYIGALVINLEPLPLLRQEHWVEHDPVISRQGRGVATKVVVRGSGDVRGEYPPGQVTDPRWPQYGSHFKRIRDSAITDPQVATERARGYWERWQQPNFQILSSRGTLGPLAPVTTDDLIPGRAVLIAITEGCMPTSLKLAETRSNGRLQYYAYDSGTPQPLVVAQRILEVNVTVKDSMEDEVRIDTQALGTERRTRGQTNWTGSPGPA